MIVYAANYSVDSAEWQLVADVVADHLDCQQAARELHARQQRLSGDLQAALRQGISPQALAQTLGLSPTEIGVISGIFIGLSGEGVSG